MESSVGGNGQEKGRGGVTGGCANMKLSEAIREKSLIKPQGRGPNALISIDSPSALGGALQSIGLQLREPTEALALVVKNWPFLIKPRFVAVCPCGDVHYDSGPFASSILVTIHRLNDNHRWTRWEIADWVATVEPQHEWVRDAGPTEYTNKLAEDAVRRMLQRYPHLRS